MAPGLIEPQPAVAADRTRSLHSVTENYEDTLRFYLNGTKVVLDTADPEVTLLEYLRGIGLTGTKLGCAEGGCGACTVVVSQFNPTTKSIYHASVNACLAPLVSVDGKHVITVEGIGSVKRPHPAQERIAKSNGSQCGFCTPGIVMSLYALLRNDSNPSELHVEEAFDGNLCRCTGYRPILDAAQTFSAERSCGMSKVNGGSGCCMEKGDSNGNSNGGGCCKSGLDADSQPIKRFTPPGFIEYNPETELIFPPALRRHEYKALAFGNKRKRWFRPVTLEQLLEIKSVYPSAKIIGGMFATSSPSLLPVRAIGSFSVLTAVRKAFILRLAFYISMSKHAGDLLTYHHRQHRDADRGQVQRPSVYCFGIRGRHRRAPAVPIRGRVPRNRRQRRTDRPRKHHRGSRQALRQDPWTAICSHQQADQVLRRATDTKCGHASWQPCDCLANI